MSLQVNRRTLGHSRDVTEYECLSWNEQIISSKRIQIHIGGVLLGFFPLLGQLFSPLAQSKHRLTELEIKPCFYYISLQTGLKFTKETCLYSYSHFI